MKQLLSKEVEDSVHRKQKQNQSHLEGRLNIINSINPITIVWIQERIFDNAEEEGNKPQTRTQPPQPPTKTKTKKSIVMVVVLVVVSQLIRHKIKFVKNHVQQQHQQGVLFLIINNIR